MRQLLGLVSTVLGLIWILYVLHISGVSPAMVIGVYPLGMGLAWLWPQEETRTEMIQRHMDKRLLDTINSAAIIREEEKIQ